MGSEATRDGVQLSLFTAPDPAASNHPPAPQDRSPSGRSGRIRVTEADSRSILTPASGFIGKHYKFTLNPYGGCAFGCAYCYARFFAPSVEAQADWGAWVRVKRNAVDELRRATRGRLRPGDAIYMATVTDPYQPVEAKHQITRRILEELLAVQPRLTIQTRSPLVTRDIDLLRQFERLRVNFTITTDTEEVRLRYEPHCPAIRVRLRAAETLADAGLAIGISISPMLPIADVGAFGRRIAALNADEYVTQYLKPARARFSAGSTRHVLQRLQAEGWTRQRYEMARDRLGEILGPGRLLEGNEGFGPPP